VAGNNGSDVRGSYSGSSNLIGGNPLLSPLGNYGGPTLTMALLPGSPASGKGASGAGVPLTDQRGVTRYDRIDIGAFQSQGFSLVPVVSSTPQSAVSGKPFANSLVVTVRANDPVEPVDGGVITFAAPASGASATLTSTTPTIADGQTSVIATANSTTGQYFVTASVDLAITVGFALTNTASVGSDPSTFMVTKTADDGSMGTLRWAIDQADESNQADTIDFSSYFDTPRTITLIGGPLALTDTATITIDGPGANLLTVSGNNASRVFDISAGSAALSGLTISGGNADKGGGLLNSGGTLTLTNCTISGDAATVQGGGIATRFGGTTTLYDCLVSSDTAPAGGGVFNSQSTLSLVNATLIGNSATTQGGALYNSGGATTLTNCTVSANSATTGGGVFSSGAGATLKLTNTIVAGQTAGGNISGSYTGSNNLIGGNPLLASLGDYGGPTFTMPLLLGSAAIGGGTSTGAPLFDQRDFPRGRSVDIGAFQTQGALVVNTRVDGTGSPAGDLSLRQAVNLANVLPTADTITFAQGFFTSPATITLTAGPLVLTDTATTTITGPGAYLLSINGNKAGEVFDIKGGSAALSGLTITGGSGDSGGGLRNEGGTVSLTDCAINGNAATGQGGGVYDSGGTLSLSGCTLSNNTAPTGAGLAGSGSALSLVNTTISGNTAIGEGGGLYLKLSSATLTNDTVSANSATTGGGLVNAGNTATVTLTNTIIAGQTAGGDVTGNYTGSNDLVGGNPLLGKLFDYGGPTLTMPPLPGSPAIGKGTDGNGVPPTDQRGSARGGSIDIGAFQSQSALVVNVTTDGPGSGLGQLDLRQAINLANIQPGTNTVTFSPSLFGTTPRTITLTEGEIGLGAAGSPVVDGPGASLLTINGNGASRVFLANATAAALSDLTITGGNADGGGGLLEVGGTLSLTGCNVVGNNSTGTYPVGGGLDIQGGTSALSDCTISGNTAGQGAGLFVEYGTATVTGCTISGNAASQGYGGGVWDESGTVSLTNTTISGNTALNGGGLSSGSSQSGMTLMNVTVAGNSASSGGGIFVQEGGVAATNAIVAGNNGGDVAGGFAGGSNNLVGGNPLLAPLGNYGGPTATMALLPGSPTIGGGTGAPAFDQRGEPRFGHVDIGAFQSQGFTLKPVAGSTPQSAVAGKPFANSLAVTVTANNPIEPVNGGIVSFVVTPVDGASATLSAATATIAGGMASVTATANTTSGEYPVSATATGAPANGFILTNTAAPGSTITPEPGAVQDVNSLASLRAAIAYADSHPGPETIIFDPAVFGKSPHTIVLTGGPLVLTDPATVTIMGPGADLLTLSGGEKSRVFDVEGGSLGLEGLTITGGRADRGGGILNDGGSVALDDIVLRGNRARMGGGLYNDGAMTLTNVVMRGNTARVGSEVFNTRAATLFWRRSRAR
jgi:hypothetical protein